MIDAGRTDQSSGTELHVLTPERVDLNLPIAGVGSRTAAQVVDIAIQTGSMLLFYLLVIGVILVGGARQFSSLVPTDAEEMVIGIVIAIVIVLAFMFTFGYYIFFEIVWSGQTPGKRWVGLRVLRDNGYPIRPGDAVIRNLFRLVDGLPTLYGLGVLVMLLNRRSKRIGDFAAGTIVVREGRRQSVGAIAELVPIPTDLAPARLRPGDAALVRDFLVRRATLTPAARTTLAARLARAMRNQYALADDDRESDEQLLERLV